MNEDTSEQHDGLGILTMAADPDAVIRACALAASLHMHEPVMPIVLLVLEGLDVPGDFFDGTLTITRPEPFGGAEHFLNKLVHPFSMTPFERTLFLDDDILLIRPVRDVVDRIFAGKELAMNTHLNAPDEPWPGENHLVPARVCEHFGHSSCMNTAGGGHMYFEGAKSPRAFLDRAISVATTHFDLYRNLSAQTFISDEVALLIAVNEAGLDLPHLPDLVDAFTLTQANEIHLDLPRSIYRWPHRAWGERIGDVRLLHFCSNSKRSLPYCKAIHRLTGHRQSFDLGLRGYARRTSMGARHRFGPSRGRRLPPVR